MQCSTYRGGRRCERTAKVHIQCNGKDVPGCWKCRACADAVLTEYARAAENHPEWVDFGTWTERPLTAIEKM